MVLKHIYDDGHLTKEDADHANIIFDLVLVALYKKDDSYLKKMQPCRFSCSTN